MIAARLAAADARPHRVHVDAAVDGRPLGQAVGQQRADGRSGGQRRRRRALRVRDGVWTQENTIVAAGAGLGLDRLRRGGAAAALVVFAGAGSLLVFALALRALGVALVSSVYEDVVVVVVQVARQLVLAAHPLVLQADELGAQSGEPKSGKAPLARCILSCLSVWLTRSARPFRSECIFDYFSPSVHRSCTCRAEWLCRSDPSRTRASETFISHG